MPLVQCSFGRPTSVSRSLEVSKCLPTTILAVPINERLVVRSSHGYSSHRPFAQGRTGLHFHRFSNRVFSTLPSSCYMTEALERRLGFTRIPSHGIDLFPPPVPSSSFEHFLSTQPEWSPRLLPNLFRDISFDESFQLLSFPSDVAIAACDGSMQSLQGAFGWVLATSSPRRILVKCSGPAHGACMDSYSAQVYGLLSLTTFLHLLGIYFKSPLPFTNICCDNVAVVKTGNKIRSRKRPEFPNETLTLSWNMLQAIRTNFHLHPDLSLFHVKGHQDKSLDPSELPFQSQLNIQADALATSFQGTSNHATAKGPLIQGTGCHLVIERQYLPTHHRRKLRTRRGNHQFLQYIQHKHRLSDVAMTHIDWKSHAQAIRHFHVTSTVFLVKANGFLLENKFIVTIQQYIRANVLHVLVKIKTLITHFDAQTLNVESGEVTFDRNYSSA
jgi:hypothetical protein